MSALEVAQVQYAERQQLARDMAAAGVQAWQQVNPADLMASWLARIGRLANTLRQAQYTAASTADAFTDLVLKEQGMSSPSAGKVRTDAFVGISSDGRPLETLLQGPAVATKAAILKGVTIDRAMATGQATLTMTLRTQVADAGRVADGVAVAVRQRTGFTRLLVGESCSRCVILAGRFYRYSDGFLRHPNDDCIMVASQDEEAATAEGLINDPQAYFDSLSEYEQDKAFGRDGAQAIRDGADMNQVVNARSGMYTAGGLALTRTGTTRRALAGQRLGKGRKRLMPEGIYELASDHEEAVRLLRTHGYIV